MRISVGTFCRVAALLLVGGQLAGCGPASVQPPAGTNAVWRITALDPKTLLVQADFSAFERQSFVAPGELRQLGDWRWKKSWQSAVRRVEAHRPATEARLQRRDLWSRNSEQPAVLGYWKSATGLARATDTAGRETVLNGASVLYQIFLSFDTPFVPGETVTLTTPLENELSFTYAPEHPSPLFKINQVGYLPQATRKAVVLGGWLGTAGPWQSPVAQPTFTVKDARTHETVLRGQFTARFVDDTTPDGIPWYGERPWEADISALTRPGRYYLESPGIGRSADFLVSQAAARAAFAVHLHGLFVQRCGSPDKKEPYTHWSDAPCHLEVQRGTFPPDTTADYARAARPNDPGFFTLTGEPLSFRPFDLIAANAPSSPEILHLPGGWHDAADYDRRPFHLNIVNDLAGVYFLRPGNFRDNDLVLPESGNGVPDILDEAAWGLEHLCAAQQTDGGVGTWIETCGHPVEGMGLPSVDTSPYYLSRATRQSTLAYCASAALLARLHPSLKERFLDSAIRAWRFVHTASPARQVPFTVTVKGVTARMTWNEREELPPQDRLKAALNLARATGDDSFLADIRTPAFKTAFAAACAREWQSWRPLRLIELLSETDPDLVGFRDQWRDCLVRGGNKYERLLAGNEIYRTPWAAPRTHPSPNGMAWGGGHPLPAALWLIAAHAVTGEARYLESAQLAYDFHCGCNPDGMTLTSGLGRIYPVSFLHLQSSADTVAECAAGITPYRWTGRPGGVADLELVHTPEEEQLWPVWRRRPNLETLHVASGEFTVWETIAPAAAVTGYLMGEADPNLPPFTIRPPAAAKTDLPGYWAIP